MEVEFPPGSSALGPCTFLHVRYVPRMVLSLAMNQTCPCFSGTSKLTSTQAAEVAKRAWKRGIELGMEIEGRLFAKGELKFGE